MPAFKKPVRKWWHGRPMLLLALALCAPTALLSAAAPAAEMDDQDLERAVQNPLLWDHFREVARASQAGYDGFGRRRYDIRDLDSRTESLIEGFLRRVSRQSWELANAAERLLEEQQTPSHSRRVADLKAVQKAARNLRGTLSAVYSYERGRQSPEPVQSPAGVRELAQLAFLTYRAVQGYVFEGDHTITVKRLQDENMLVCLARIQDMAVQLQRQSFHD